MRIRAHRSGPEQGTLGSYSVDESVLYTKGKKHRISFLYYYSSALYLPTFLYSYCSDVASGYVCSINLLRMWLQGMLNKSIRDLGFHIHLFLSHIHLFLSLRDGASWEEKEVG